MNKKKEATQKINKDYLVVLLQRQFKILPVNKLAIKKNYSFF